MKISMTEGMSVLRFSEDGHYLYGGSSTGKYGCIARDCLFVGNAFGDLAQEEKYSYWSHCWHRALQ